MTYCSKYNSFLYLFLRIFR